jgi:hypothetical protein
MPYAVRSDDGLWMLDGSGILQLDLDGEMKNALKQLPLNHSQRRALLARVWKSGHLTKFGLSLLRPYWAGVGAQISGRFPVTNADDIVELFGRLLAGSIDKKHFEQEFARFLFRPTQMATFVFEMDEIRKHCPQFVVTMGERLVQMVSDLRAGLTLIPQFQRRKLARYLPDTVARKSAVQAALRDRHRVRGAKLTDAEVEGVVCRAKIGALPAVDLISRVSKVYAMQHATMPRNPELSDGPDFMHLTYLPYCDVFRTDTYMVELLKQCDALVTATVVRSLHELPAVIERLIASPGSSADSAAA